MAEPIHPDTLHFITSDINISHAPRPRRSHDTFPTKPSKESVRFVVVSDTHSHPDWHRSIPDGDVFIHCGDLTRGGTVTQLIQVYQEIKTLSHKHKIVIAGNHDLGLDPDFIGRHQQQLQKINADMNDVSCKRLRRLWKSREASLAGIIFLEHETVDLIVRGQEFRIFGSPWTPAFCDWAFMYPVETDIWSPKSQAIQGRPALGALTGPHKNVWITHGPAHGTLDAVPGIGPVGCPFLRDKILEQKPDVHFFGHIHEGAELGRVEIKHEDGVTIAVNAAMLDEQYRLAYPATVIDL